MKKARRIVWIIITGLSLLWAGTAASQSISTIKIALEIKNKSLKEVFRIIEQKSGLHFIYNDNLVSVYSNISFSGTDRSVSSVLNELLGKTNLTYIEQNNRIIIEKKNTIPPGPAEPKLIIGRILERGTDKPVRNASIYFDGTLNGTTSDSSGNFTMYPQTNKNVPVVISAVGYNTETVKEVQTGKRVIVYLTIRQYDLEAVTISASDGMSRKEKLRIFRKEFLGTSANARSCEIVNEDDIKLSYNSTTKTMRGFSDKPIIVRNRKLGYTLNFLPKELTFSPERVMVQGYQFFEEDPSRSGDEKIQKARESAYLGSQLHFIRSLWNNDLEKNDFNIYRGGLPATYANSRFQVQTSGIHQISYDSIVSIRNDDKYIHLDGRPVYIVHKGRKSYVNTLDSVKEGLISNNGHSDPSALIWSGFIGTQRVGDALPLEYKMGDHTRPVEGVHVKNIIASADTSGIHGIISSMDTLRSRMPAEKLYIQFDKPYYSTGDTIRLKAYLLDAAFLAASQKSGIAYVELANDTNKVLLRRMLLLDYGLGMGEIVLNKEDIPEGSYTIRAYTNLMRNFGEDRIFKKSFYVSGNSAQSWLVNSKVLLSKQSDKDNMHLELQFNKLDKKSLGMHALELRVRDGKKILLKDNAQTDVDGKLDVNFNLPEKTDPGNISLVVGDLTKGQEDHKITIPLPISRPENTDLQFMPEGGNLVAGISSVVGFKAIGEDGKGVNVNGKVFSGSQEVAVFSSSYKGMGSFEFDPKQGETYTAKVVLNGTEKSFPLPPVKSSGTVIRVTNNAESDSIEVSISATAPATYYLIAQSRGIICYAAAIRLSGNKTIKKIAKSLFPTGISRFTVMNSDRQPLNERVVYITHQDNLNITLSPASASFGKRDSISLDILVTDKDKHPVQGSFSLSVTDDNQVRTDSLGSNMLTTLLVTSDLKGLVEDPGHYLQQTGQAWKDLDHLLLTQGWTGYDWKDVFNPPVPVYAAEKEFIVNGRVSNVFNKNSAETSIRLLSMNPPLIRDSLTRKDGTFTYTGLPVADSVAFFLQARNKNNKSFNVGIEVDEFKSLAFPAESRRFMPWYVNSDTSLLKYVKAVVQQKEEQLKLSGNVLGAVTITAKKIIKDSKNLNGPGESDQTLDEKDLRKAEKTTLLQLLKDRISGFNEGPYPHPKPPRKPNEPYRWSYRINKSEIHLVIDGMDVEKFYTGAYFWTECSCILHKERFFYIQNYLLAFTAEDVKGIEVMFNPKYNSRYNRILDYAGDPVTNDFAYIEITTKSGKGPFQGTKPGIYTYKPMPFILPKTFYRPRYTVRSNAPLLTDLRSTIHWEPNIVTDKEGKAQVSFYSADSQGTYSVILEGSDMNGSIGRQTGTITIK